MGVSSWWELDELAARAKPQADCGSGNANAGTHNQKGGWAAKELMPDRIVFKRIRELWSKKCIGLEVLLLRGAPCLRLPFRQQVIFKK